MTLYPVGLVWFCTVENRQQKVVLKRKTLEGRSLLYTRNRRGPSTVPCGTPDVTAARDDVFPSRTTCWFLSIWESFGSRIGFCLWCDSDGAWLQGTDGEPYQKPCWNPAKLHQLVAVCPIQLRDHLQWWWAESHKISFSWSHAGSRSESCCFQKLHKMTMHYVFHDFTVTRCQWNWSTVRSLALVPLLEQRCHESSFLVIRNMTLSVGSLIYEC